ncbi:MAG: lasso peptide biosynthesis B2 protein [Acidobacteria bacterium]|nr:lasso peptide biosynthesis B2 protein [Acidobacteriota bacterium]
MWRRIRSFLSRPPGERRALVEALFLLGAGRVALLSAPFPVVARRYHLGSRDTAAEHRHDAASQAHFVARMIASASRHTPWRSTCLVQALAATRMLRRRHVASTLYFGAARDEAGAFRAHAWVRCEAHLVTGGREHERFEVVGVFGVSEARGNQVASRSRSRSRA